MRAINGLKKYKSLATDLNRNKTRQYESPPIKAGLFHARKENMYQGLMLYLEKCPQLKGQKFNFNFLGSKPVQWALTIPTNSPEQFTSTVGDKHNKLDFILVSVEHFGDDSANNINNLDGFQEIKRWFERNNRNKIFPELDAGQTVTGVYAQTDGYIEDTTANLARYQIQCRVEYIQENTNPTRLPRFITEE